MVTFKGNAVSLKGKEVNVGDSAPKVELIAGDLSAKSVGGASGKFQIINVVPSLDTGVCATQTRKFNEKAASLSNAEVFVVSLDLPFAQGRFCSIEGIQNVVALSDFKNKAFGESYGIFWLRFFRPSVPLYANTGRKTRQSPILVGYSPTFSTFASDT